MKQFASPMLPRSDTPSRDSPHNTFQLSAQFATFSKIARSAVGTLLLVTLAACGSGSGGGSNGPVDPPPPQVVNQTTPGTAIVKVAASGSTWIALSEKLQPVANVTVPDRRLLIGGNTATPLTFTPAAGWSLIDATIHPSQQITLALASARQVRLVRMTAQGQLLADFDLVDIEAPFDPFMSDPIYIRDATSLVPFSSRDAVRVAAIGEEVALALRSGKNAVIAYRYRFVAGGFDRQWRTLVEPGVYIGNGGITSGTFDPFGSLDNQWRLVMAVRDDGRMAIAVNVNRTELAAGHGSHFGEATDEFDHGFIVTSLSPTGQREGSAIINLGKRSDVHAITWNGNEVAVAGRIYSESRADGTGWNGYVALTRPAEKRLVANQVIDVDRGDAILQAQALADGRYLVSGSTGYVQNPAGASVSESAEPLLAILDSQGRLVQRVAVTGGQRHNQLRGLALWKGKWLLGGMTNGPGTHSADGNPALLSGDGFVREVSPAIP